MRMRPSARGESEEFEAEILHLLGATEALAERMLAAESGDALAAALAARNTAFDRVSAVARDRQPASAVVRAALDSIRRLDAAMIRAGSARRDAIRDELEALSRSRSAVEMHARRERVAPRVVTLKA